MALIVQKYGGTSVADPDRMRAVAENVAFTRRHGDDVVVVVSAMGKATDNLIALASQVSTTRPGREMDMLLTTGERVSAALLTMALSDLGIDAVSFTGSQVGIITDTTHGKAKIVEVKGDRVRDALAAGKVCVVAGFQGVSTEREITTMGRGASDLTASALAKALGAAACEIYTDVTGVFSADPRIVPRARRLAHVSFEEMLEMAGAGSKVLALRSVEFARNHGVSLHVRSAFTWEPGTWVTEETDESRREPSVEDPIISGVVTDSSESKVTVLGRSGPPGDLGLAVRAARRRQRQRRHDRAEHVDRRVHRHQLHDAVGRHGRRRGHRQAGRRRDRRDGSDPRRRHRPAVTRRGGDEDLSRHRGEDVPHARRREREHRDDLDVHDPDLGGDRQRRPGAGRPRVAHGVRARTRVRITADPSPNANSPPPTVGARRTIEVYAERAPNT